jgi:hypothetical protein
VIPPKTKRADRSLGRFVSCAVNKTFPGTSAHAVLLVSGMQTAVAIRLRLNASPWMITTGRRYPGTRTNWI